MDVDGGSHRGTKRKADDLSVVTAPRRIKASLLAPLQAQPNSARLSIQMLSTKLLQEKSLLLQSMLSKNSLRMLLMLVPPLSKFWSKKVD